MLTGTPLQNDLEELQNLLSFLLPDVFNADVAAQLADEQAWAAGPHKMEPIQCSVYLGLSRESATRQLSIVRGHAAFGCSWIPDLATLCDDAVSSRIRHMAV